MKSSLIKNYIFCVCIEREIIHTKIQDNYTRHAKFIFLFNFFYFKCLNKYYKFILAFLIGY